MLTDKKRILIADDDPTVLLILRATLERMSNGYTILTAQDGNEAWSKVQEMPFDLIITDVRMPGLDGIALVEALRGVDADTAVIWITAYGCHQLEAEGERLDVYRCLDKPLRIDQIRQAAQAALATDSGSDRTDA